MSEQRNAKQQAADAVWDAAKETIDDHDAKHADQSPENVKPWDTLPEK